MWTLEGFVASKHASELTIFFQRYRYETENVRCIQQGNRFRVAELFRQQAASDTGPYFYARDFRLDSRWRQRYSSLRGGFSGGPCDPAFRHAFCREAIETKICVLLQWEADHAVAPPLRLLDTWQIPR